MHFKECPGPASPRHRQAARSAPPLRSGPAGDRAEHGSGTNALLVIFWLTLSHLQHSHVWLPITGIWGRIITSPSHHQIHHSKLPHHLGKNLGGHLAVWDWAFGTLYIPSKQREALDLGVDGPYPQARNFTLAVFQPFADSLATLWPRKRDLALETPPSTAETGRRHLTAA